MRHLTLLGFAAQLTNGPSHMSGTLRGAFDQAAAMAIQGTRWRIWTLCFFESHFAARKCAASQRSQKPMLSNQNKTMMENPSNR